MRRLAGAGLLLALVVGCTPDVSMSKDFPVPTPDSPSVERDTTPKKRDSEPVPRHKTPPKRPGDLDTGSVTHKIAAGDRSVVINYWTDQKPKTWTADKRVPVNISAHLEDTGDTNAVKASRVYVQVLPTGEAPDVLLDDQGEFVMTPPYDYSTVVTVPAKDDDTPTDLAVQFDLLVETEPDSGTYFRSTVQDTLHLTFQERP